MCPQPSTHPISHTVRWLARPLAALLAAGLITPAFADLTLLNVSYDVSRELYKDINPVFAKQWQARHGEKITINQSHGGSSKQALSVAAGLEADVVTMNQAPDIDVLTQRGQLVSADWRKRLPYQATPYTTPSVFLVRKGNPKKIRDWDDLAKPGIAVIVPNPKTSGNGRYTYLAAWGSVLHKGGSEAQAKEFVTRLFQNVPVLDGGGRGATTTFTQRQVGDVLVTFENEAALIAQELGNQNFEVVYPSVSIEAEAPVAVVDKVVDRRQTRIAAQAYLDFLFTPEGQEIIARHHFRPRDPNVFKRYAKQFPKLATFTVDSQLGGWSKVQKEHFAEGGLLDQITVKK